MRSPTFISGISITLIMALYRMLEVRACRKRLPCFRRNAQKTAIVMFNEFWQTLTPEEEEEIRYRLMQCLYWRTLGCFHTWEHFQEMWSGFYGMEDGFEGWCETRGLNNEKPMKLILRVLRLRKIRLSATEVQYCLAAVGPSAKEKAADIAYRLLLRGCWRVRIPSITKCNALLVKYSLDDAQWTRFRIV